MPSLKEVRIRIASVKSTQQITNAMKLVSAAKLRRAQESILKFRPYAAKLKNILINLSSSISDNEDNVYAQKREVEKVLIIPISSNRGLCGAFNSNIFKATNLLIQNKYAAQNNKNNVFIYTIGKKSYEYFSKRNYNVVDNNAAIFDNITFDNVSEIAQSIMNDFTTRKYDKIEVIYNQFKNAAVQILTTEQFLPIDLSSIKTTTANEVESDYIFEPNKEVLVNQIIPKSLKIQFYKMILDTYASEHGARMTAMHKATDNAADLIKELMLTYNKARQASITKEILEIVGGAEALKG